MKHLNILFLFLLCFVFFSCSKDDNEKRIEYAKIVEGRLTQDLLNDLYVGSGGDVEAIARIMNVTPSSIDRIRNGETEPTDEFDERVHEVSIYYMQNDQNFEQLRSVVDPEYGWYDTVLNFPSIHPWWFWTTVIIIVLLGLLSFIIPVFFIDVVGAILLLLLFLVAWIASLICSPDVIQDSYVDSINPTIEQVK